MQNRLPQQYLCDVPNNSASTMQKISIVGTNTSIQHCKQIFILSLQKNVDTHINFNLLTSV